MKDSVLPVNKYSRPGLIRPKTMAIVVHWPQAPGWTAEKVYSYFARAHLEKVYRSTQWAIGLEGEVVAIVPEWEIAYHAGSKTYTDKAKKFFGDYNPNQVSIGVEVCHLDEDGHMTPQTMLSLEKFLYEKCIKYNLDPATALWRHYDVVGYKDCPRYFVEHPDQWESLKCRVIGRILTRCGKDEPLPEGNV